MVEACTITPADSMFVFIQAVLRAHFECCMQTTASPATSEFEQELADYMKALKLPAAAAAHIAKLCNQHDFSAARTHLIISRPGYHSGKHVAQLYS